MSLCLKTKLEKDNKNPFQKNKNAAPQINHSPPTGFIFYNFNPNVQADWTKNDSASRPIENKWGNQLLGAVKIGTACNTQTRAHQMQKKKLQNCKN